MDRWKYAVEVIQVLKSIGMSNRGSEAMLHIQVYHLGYCFVIHIRL